MKEGSSRLEEAIKNEIVNERYIPELKIEHEDEKDNYLAIAPKSIPPSTQMPMILMINKRNNMRMT